MKRLVLSRSEGTVTSFEEQFAELVRRISSRARAYLCDGDPRSAVAWDPESEITIRLSLKGDEIWVMAGSALLIRDVAASDGEFDLAGIDLVVDEILGGRAVEHFGLVGQSGTDVVVATGFRLESGRFAGGRNEGESLFKARVGGPFARLK